MSSFILFFGTRDVIRDDPGAPTQTMPCPVCRNIVTFKARQARHYFHLFWLPLIPLGDSHHILECPACRSRFPNNYQP